MPFTGPEGRAAMQLLLLTTFHALVFGEILVGQLG